MGTSANILIGAASVSVGGSDVGFTMGGTTVRYEPEVRDIMADQALGVVRKVRTAERLYVVTTFLESTLANLRRAFMVPTANLAGSTLTLGYHLASFVDEVQIILTGTAPDNGTRTFTFPKCVTLNSKEIALSREEETAFEVEFEVLKQGDPLRFGTIVDS